ncbi:MAG: hypothetical protein D3909_05815 [Candidatus Electrothrix sp. ATG1]|nr:hypothetical protein [Candidatus Electrothrix sp. ATG1]
MFDNSKVGVFELFLWHYKFYFLRNFTFDKTFRVYMKLILTDFLAYVNPAGALHDTTSRNRKDAFNYYGRLKRVQGPKKRFFTPLDNDSYELGLRRDSLQNQAIVCRPLQTVQSGAFAESGDLRTRTYVSA